MNYVSTSAVNQALESAVPRIGKTSCRYFYVPSSATAKSEGWAQYPGLNVALDGIAAYADWVSGVVLPIVFQYVEDHKEQVYKAVPADLYDDIGAVVAAAFEFVKQQGAYKRGQEALAEYQAKIANGTWDPSAVNPTWSEISKSLREQMHIVLAP